MKGMVEYWLIDEDGYAETLATEKIAHQHGGTVTTVRRPSSS